MNAHDPPTDFDWRPQPEAAGLLLDIVNDALYSNDNICFYAQRLLRETGTRLVNWLDSIVIGETDELRNRLISVGFQHVADRGWVHPGGMFPTFILESANHAAPRLILRVESMDDFAGAINTNSIGPASGQSGAQFRYAVFFERTVSPPAAGLEIVEHHGTRACGPMESTARSIAAAAKHRTAMARRRRSGGDCNAGFELAVALFDAAAADLNPGWAADLFFAAEREYWMSRNRAAQVQYKRQQQFGLGWANHDHHTYRSSRECFHLLVAALEHMGFICRERFYAGREAGWGAQVLEDAATGVVIFADVDLSPEEVADDFAHQPLLARDELGTVGLWCKLHGESFLEAGMHHLECQFDFDAAREQLTEAGIETMAPFTDFPHLKQAFTQGELWPVSEERLQAALDGGHITVEQADQFRRDGALGSHMEILERNDGYKGFNQTGISEIITRTDPRKW